MITSHTTGWPAIGMNGVFGFSKRGGKFVDSAAHGLPPKATHILIADSLNTENKKSMRSVLQARLRWRVGLSKLYPEATLLFVELPKPPTSWPKQDWGIDDAYVIHGKEWVMDVVKTAKVFKETNEIDIWLNEFKEQFVYVMSVSKVYDRKLEQFLTKQNFFDNYATAKVGDVDIPKLWFTSTERLEVSGLAFTPSKPEIVDGKLNLWQGFAETRSSNPNTVAELWVDTIYDGIGPDGKHLIEFFAMLVQRPEVRLSRHLFLGGKNGVGKNFIIEPINRIFKYHYQPWTIQNFINTFNAPAQNCRWGVINEAPDPATMKRGDKDTVAAILRMNADQNEAIMQLEGKGKDVCLIDRLQTNAVISNYGPPYALQADDRRALMFLVRQHMCAKRENNRGTKPDDYWGVRWNWLNFENGSAEILDYLLNYDLSKVDWDGPAPVTAYKAQLLRNTSDTINNFMETLNADPTGVFQNAVGPSWKLPSYYVFDAQVVVMAFNKLIYKIENEKGAKIVIGRTSLAAWECVSTQVSQRTLGPGLGPSTTGARIFGVYENKICEHNKDLMNSRAAMEFLTKFQIALEMKPQEGVEDA